MKERYTRRGVTRNTLLRPTFLATIAHGACTV